VNYTLPKDDQVSLLVSEFVRQEQGGKVSILGYFPGNLIYVPLNTETVSMPLTFLFVVQGGEGILPTFFTLMAPSGRAMMDRAKLPDSEKKSGLTLSVIVQIIPFQSDEFGKYRAILRLGTENYERALFIERQKPV
jgi:hypothetical protein